MSYQIEQKYQNDMQNGLNRGFIAQMKEEVLQEMEAGAQYELFKYTSPVNGSSFHMCKTHGVPISAAEAASLESSYPGILIC